MSIFSNHHHERLLHDLDAEVEELREENARLRADQQRPLDPHSLAAHLDDVTRAMSLEDDDGSDDAARDRQSMLEVQVTRQGLLEVCTQLQALAGQVRRQLVEGIPAPEIDRRVTEVRVPHERRQAPSTRPFDDGPSGPDAPASRRRNGSTPPGTALTGERR